MKRDLYSTVTGWRWLDKLTLPFWVVYCKIQEWRLYRTVGKGDVRRGKAIVRKAAQLLAEEERV